MNEKDAIQKWLAGELSESEFEAFKKRKDFELDRARVCTRRDQCARRCGVVSIGKCNFARQRSQRSQRWRLVTALHEAMYDWR